MTEKTEMDRAGLAESGTAQEGKPAPGPGALLAEYREQAGLTVEQVASRLKMTNRQVLQIEADNFESMSNTAIARGFVRAYARLLNVDPEPLVAMFPAENPQAHLPVQTRRAPAEAISVSRTTFRKRNGGVWKLVGWILIVLLVVGAVAVWRSGVLSSGLSMLKRPAAESKDTPAKQEPKKEPVKAESAPASGVVSTELSLPKTVVSEEAKPAEPAKQDTPVPGAAPESHDSPPAPAAGAQAAQPQPADARSDPGSPVVSAGKGTLVLRASARSWVQILPANAGGTDTVLYERTLMPGQSESIVIREPVAVTIGYARGIEANFRGKPLELKTAEGSTVARLNLK